LPKYPNDPERLPKEIILRRAADLAEALYNRSPADQLSHYAYSVQFDPDYARNYSSPRGLTGYASATAATATTSTAQTLAPTMYANTYTGTNSGFLNPPAGFPSFGTMNPFSTLQSLQKPGTY
jgi:early B-cell factor